jgi:hypothetical protein
LVGFDHELEDFIVSPRHPFVTLLVFFVIVAKTGRVVELDFVNLNDVNDTPDKSKHSTSEDDVVREVRLDGGSGGEFGYLIGVHTDYPYFSFV